MGTNGLALALGLAALLGTGKPWAAKPDADEKPAGPKQDERAGTAEQEPETKPESTDGQQQESRVSAETEPGWMDFELEGVHGFAGVALGPALMGDWYYGSSPTWHPGFLLALRGGVLFDHVELAAELAPVSMWWSFDAPSIFSFNLTIGGQLELAPHVFWPLRFGLGATAVNLPHDEAAMQGRLDLIGLIYQAGHVEIELDLLSARFSSEFQHFGLWSAPFALAGSYVF